MTQLQIIVLAIIQGLAEYMPISSSGHLILLSKFTAFEDQGLVLDIALHFGSILAVIIYFYKDILLVIKDLFASRFVPSLKTEGSRLFWLLVVATIPAVVVGLALYYSGMEWLRSIRIVGWNILIFGTVLWFVDKYSNSDKKIEDLTIKHALFIGVAQSMALIPGTSRSGVTITMARFLGINRIEAAKFSMLLSIPAIVGASLLAGWELYRSDEVVHLFEIFNAVSYSFIISIAVIFFMMSWLKKYSFLPFVVYRVILGLVLLYISYS